MPKDQKREQKKDKPQGDKNKEKKTHPLTEEEKAAQAKVDKIEKEIEQTQAAIKDIMGKIREKESTRSKLRNKVMENRDALNKIYQQITEKRHAQSEAFSKAQRYIDSLRKRRNRRADERAELMKLLPRDAQLPPLREDEEGAGGVSDYDRAIKIVMEEIEKVQQRHRISSFTAYEERKMMGAEARWKSVIEKIKELEQSAAAPLADLAEVDVLGCLETCRKLKEEINQLQDSCIPHYKEIADSIQKLEENRTGVPKLIQDRDALLAQVKGSVAKLQEANFEFDMARYKAVQARNQKRREEIAKESAAIKARIEEIKKNREARIEKAMNTLPHEREVAAAKDLLSYLRTIALPGTCDTSESAAPKAKPQAKPQPTLTSAPSVELEEASFGATEMIVSRKSQPVPKVAKKQNKKKKAAPAEQKPAEPKKKSPEDPVQVSPAHLNNFEILSLTVPETYGDVEARYNEIKERLEGYEKVRAAIREEREKSLQEAEKKALEEAEKKEEAKQEEEKPKEEEPKAEEEKPKEEEPKAEEPAAATEEPAAESQ